jgi:S1-C subfamily serine protease
VVSAVRRSGTGFNLIEDFIQTDATVNPGGSGGALIDAEGRLVGLVSAIFTKESDADIGVNFAASMVLVLRVIEDLKAHGRVERGALGIEINDLSLDERAQGGGARISEVRPDGPAARAGLRVGDIVTEVAGRRIAKVSDVVAAVQLHRIGDRLEVVARRDGVPVRVLVEVGQ